MDRFLLVGIVQIVTSDPGLSLSGGIGGILVPQKGERKKEYYSGIGYVEQS